MQYVMFTSYGNDSIALMQWAHERGLRDVHTAFSDTGWAAPWWMERVEQAEAWARSLGFTPHRIASEGMEALVARKKAWPRGGGGKYQAALQSAQHVCGAQGFGALGDSCPCCKAQHNGCAGC